MSEILQWTVNYCKLFCNHQTNHVIDILYTSSWTQHLRAWKAWEVRNFQIAADADPGWKPMKTSMIFFQQNWTPWPFLVGMFWFTQEFLWISKWLPRYKNIRTPGARWQDAHFLVVSLLLFLFLGRNSFSATSLQRVDHKTREIRAFSVFQVWPVDVDDQFAWPKTCIRKTPDEAPFHGDLSKYVQSWDFFQVTMLLPIDVYMYSRRTFKFRSGVAASTASNMGHHLRLWVRWGV